MHLLYYLPLPSLSVSQTRTCWHTHVDSSFSLSISVLFVLFVGAWPGEPRCTLQGIRATSLLSELSAHMAPCTLLTHTLAFTPAFVCFLTETQALTPKQVLFLCTWMQHHCYPCLPDCTTNLTTKGTPPRKILITIILSFTVIFESQQLHSAAVIETIICQPKKGCEQRSERS